MTSIRRTPIVGLHAAPTDRARHRRGRRGVVQHRPRLSARLRRAHRQAQMDLPHRAARRASSATTPGSSPARPKPPPTPASGRRCRRDAELGLVYAGVELPQADTSGMHPLRQRAVHAKPWSALDVETGERKWHYQTEHHGIWDRDICSRRDAVRPRATTARSSRRWRCRPSRPSCSCWTAPPASRSGRSAEKKVEAATCPANGIRRPSRSLPSRRPFDRQGFSLDDVIDWTPEIKARAAGHRQPISSGPDLHAAHHGEGRTAPGAR